MSIKHKVWILLTLILIALVIMSSVGLMTMRVASVDDNEARVNQVFKSTYNSIISLEQQAASGLISDQQAKQIATNMLRQNYYHDSEYVYVADSQLSFIATPHDPQLHGTSFHDFKDGNGQSVGQILLTAVKAQPKGIAKYKWSRAQANGTIENKLSIAQMTPRWGWYVGTGIGFNEVDQRFWAVAKWQVMICLALMAVLGSLLFYVTKAKLKELSSLRDSIRNVDKAFDLSSRIAVISDDELGQTSVAFNHMLETLQKALDETKMVVTAIANGNFQQRVKADLVGDLAELKQGVNQSAGSVATTMSALEEVMQALSNGRFDVRMSERVAGDLKRTVDEAMANSQAALQDIGRSVEALSRGDCTQQVEREMSGDWQALKTRVNQTIHNVDQSFEEINGVMQAMQNGDFSRQVEGSYQGQFNRLKLAMNKTVSGTKLAIASVNQVITSLALGQFQTVDCQALHGEFAQLGLQINQSMNNLELAFADINQVAQSLSEGDLSAQITQQYQGELGLSLIHI